MNYGAELFESSWVNHHRIPPKEQQAPTLLSEIKKMRTRECAELRTLTLVNHMDWMDGIPTELNKRQGDPVELK